MTDTEFQRYRRKANQAWENAGLARQDGDTKDAERWTREAKRLDALAGETGTKRPPTYRLTRDVSIMFNGGGDPRNGYPVTAKAGDPVQDDLRWHRQTLLCNRQLARFRPTLPRSTGTTANITTFGHLPTRSKKSPDKNQTGQPPITERSFPI
jgi:hypothetical protein